MTTPSPPSGPDDARDPRVAAWLAVDDLDEVTRARLVRTALAAASDPSVDAPGGPAHPARRRLASIVAVAAVLLALVVVAVAVLVPRDHTTTTAADAPASKPAPEASRQAGDSSAAAAPDQQVLPAEAGSTGAALVLRDLGDLGDVSTGDRLRSAVTAALSLPAGPATTTVSGCASDAGRSFGTPVAAGTGRIHGRRATIVVSTQAAGSTAAVALRGDSCAEGVSVILP